MGEPGVGLRSGVTRWPVRVLLVCDVELHRDALAMRLALIGSISVVAVASLGAKALRVASALCPDVTLVDVAASAEPALFVAALRHMAPSSRVLVVGGACPGAEGEVLGLDTTFPELLAHILGDTDGDRDPSAESRLATLSARELEIVALIEEGLSNKQIAARLSIELATVKNHVHHILGKLELSRRGEVAALLRRAPNGAPE